MDSQNKESVLELVEISEQSCEQLDSESEDEVVEDTSYTELQTGGDLPMVMESQISKDFGVEIPIIGMVFQSENQAYNFYNAYAKSVGFSIRKSKTSRRRDKKISKRVFCCSNEGVRGKHPRGAPTKARPHTRTDCKARIVIKLQVDGDYVLVEFIEEHNHEHAPPSKVHMLRSQRKIQDAQAGVIGIMYHAGIGPMDIFSEAGGSHKQNIMQDDCNNYEQRRRNKILKKGDARILLDYFKRMQRENPSFFYSIEMDADNQMCSCFWCDAKSRIDYSFFGDVVCFDTTYRTNGYNMPCVPIVGVNNHGQAILFGCVLLLEENPESFVWLFETFLDAMYGKQPKTILTDQDSSIANAVRQVLPNTNHRLCLWHIYQNAKKHLSSVFEMCTSFMKDFKSCIYDNETEEEFQSSWDTLLENYNVVENEWLQGLYQTREKWVQVYGRDHFSAGMTTTQRSEDINNYFKKYFKKMLAIREFLSLYEKAVTSRRNKEEIENFESMQTKLNLLTEWTVEEQAAGIYTRNIFSSFQEEYLRCMDLFLQPDGEDGTKYTFKVSSYRGSRPCTVTFDSSDNTTNCNCKKFEFTGILCAHALKILHSRELPNLPSQYYLKRWTKDAAIGVVVDDCGKTVQVGCCPSLTLRYSELAQIALTLAVKGSGTEKSSALAKNELTRVLEEIDYCLRNNLDQALEDIKSVNHGNRSDESVSDHSGANMTLWDPPSKKAKSLLEKIGGKNKIQPQPWKGGIGTREQSDQIFAGGIGTPSRPRMVPIIPRLPLHPTIPSNMPYYTQGGWSAQPSWHYGMLPLNVVGCPGVASMQGLTFHPAGTSHLPLVPCVYPYVYAQGSVKPIDQATSNHGTNSTQSSQGLTGLETPESSAHQNHRCESV